MTGLKQSIGTPEKIVKSFDRPDFKIEYRKIDYPSISKVLSETSDKTALFEWRKRVGEAEANRISRQSASRGSSIHSYLENFLKNGEIVLDKTVISPLHYAQVKCGVKLFADHVDSVFLTEGNLFSNLLKIKGRVDLAATWKNKNSIIDVKTSKKLRSVDIIEKYFIQAAAYAIMFEERTKIKTRNLVIVMLIDDLAEPSIYEASVEDFYKPLKERIDQYYSLTS